jgi:hypothetical protein
MPHAFVVKIARDAFPKLKRSQDYQTTIKYIKNTIVGEQATDDHKLMVRTARDNFLNEGEAKNQTIIKHPYHRIIGEQTIKESRMGC